MKTKNRISKVALCVFIGAAILACVVMCLVQKTLTARAYELATMAVSTVAGWIAIYWSLDIIGERKKRISHAENILNGEREEVFGLCEVTKETVRIPASITVVKVKIGERRLNLDRELIKSFDYNGKTVRAECVHSYIVSCEVAE